MTKNREIAEIIFNAISEMGYKPYDIKYGNSYFIFDRGEDSVVHFRLNKLWKHWKFGLWINSEYLDDEYREKEKDMTWDEKYKVVQLFAQYDTQIDKFKPSRSSLLVQYDACDWNKRVCESYKNPWYQIRDMLGMMKRHPFMCYAEFCGQYAGYYKGSFLAEFIKYEGIDKLKKAKELLYTAFFVPYTKVKIFLAKKSKTIDDIVWIDFEKQNPGWATDYKHEIKIIFAEKASDKQIVKWLGRWFRRERYGNYGFYDCVIKIGDFRQVGDDTPFTYTQGENNNA